jgi:hypothetical protein
MIRASGADVSPGVCEETCEESGRWIEERSAAILKGWAAAECGVDYSATVSILSSFEWVCGLSSTFSQLWSQSRKKACQTDTLLPLAVIAVVRSCSFGSFSICMVLHSSLGWQAARAVLAECVEN